MSEYPITPAVLRQRAEAPLRHGGRSEYQIGPSARAHKRRLLRQMNKRIGDLDGIALALIDNWARAYSKVALMDEYFAEHGLIRNGEIDPGLRTYYTGLNSSRVAIERLATHLRSKGEPVETLADYIATAYGPGSNGDGDHE